MSVIRAFIALDLSDELYQQLEALSKDLKKRLPDVPIRWVPVENVHLTLKFLGDVSLSNLEILKKMLETEVRTYQPFVISVGGLGAFPSTRRPRVIWTGVEAPAELAHMQRGIEAQTTRLGYAADTRSFSPHLTLGRVSRNANSNEVREVSEVLDGHKVGFLGVTRIQEVHLYRSDLQPGGAVYTRLFSAPLSLPQKDV